MALRSDGAAVHFGQNALGEGNIPPLPPGLRYVAVDTHYLQTMMLRSDGAVIRLGINLGGQTLTPPAGPGRRYVQVAAGYSIVGALRDDGTLALWGSVPSQTTPSRAALPPLPNGVTYVEIRGGTDVVVARRSDGQVVVTGSRDGRDDQVPILDPGTSYVQVAGGRLRTVGRVGPTSTYVTFAPGCAGSRPASRLVPMDTPKLGATLEVNILDLPMDAAILALGWQRTAPVALDFLGLTGCSTHISLDALEFVSGSGGTATARTLIPWRPALIGLHFFHQALVFDPAANNPALAVASNAAEGVIGYP